MLSACMVNEQSATSLLARQAYAELQGNEGSSLGAHSAHVVAIQSLSAAAIVCVKRCALGTHGRGVQPTAVKFCTCLQPVPVRRAQALRMDLHMRCKTVRIPAASTATHASHSTASPTEHTRQIVRGRRSCAVCCRSSPARVSKETSLKANRARHALAAPTGPAERHAKERTKQGCLHMSVRMPELALSRSLLSGEVASDFLRTSLLRLCSTVNISARCSQTRLYQCLSASAVSHHGVVLVKPLV